MPSYNFAEFSKLTGKPTKHFTTYAKRRKLVISEDRKIDIDNPINALFLEKNKHNATAETEDTTTAKKSKSKAKVPTTKKSTRTTKKESSEQSELVTLELQKKRLEVEKLERENQIKEEDLKFKRGETVNLAKTIRIVKSYSDNFKKEIDEKTKQLITDICTRYNIPADKAGDYKTRITDLINNSSANSVKILRDL